MHGHAVEDCGAGQGVEVGAVVELVDVDAWLTASDAEPRVGQVVAPAVRQGHHAPADGVRDLDRDSEFAAWALDKGGVGESE